MVVQSLSSGKRSVVVQGGSDARYLTTGHVVYALRDGLFGVAFDAVRQRVDVDQRRLALALALGEHLALWPFISLVDRDLVTSSRAFAQATYRHALFGFVLGRLA